MHLSMDSYYLKDILLETINIFALKFHGFGVALNRGYYK
jgi:hypothetical protein